MNWDRIKGEWTAVKGKLREQYGDLTDDDLEKTKGERDQLLGLIQQKYGKAKHEVERELDALFERA